MYLASINTLHLMISEIQPLFLLPIHLDVMGENNTRTALKGCGVKSLPNIFLFLKKFSCPSLLHQIYSQKLNLVFHNRNIQKLNRILQDLKGKMIITRLS